MTAAVLTWLGLITLVFYVCAYWLYTLAGMTFLRAVLGKWRRVGVALGGVAALCGGVLYPGGVWSAVVMLIVVILGTYLVRNQWLVPRYAPILVPGGPAPQDSELVVVLPSGAAVPLTWMTRLRCARYEDTLVVHCGLALSLSAFRYSQEMPRIGAVLPHDSGFEIGNARAQWDGVNGRPLSASAALERVSVGLCVFSDWRDKHPEAPLLTPNPSADVPPLKQRSVKLPGARTVTEPMSWGKVVNGRWEAVQLPSLTESDEDDRVYYMSRWAAYCRGRLQVHHSDSIL